MEQYFPNFKIEPRNILDRTNKYIDELNQYYEVLVSKNNPTWKDIEILQKMEAELDHYLFNIRHLKSVQRTKELEDEYSKLFPILNKFNSKWKQDKRIFNLYTELDKKNKDQTKKYILKNLLKELEDSGINLSEDDKCNLNTINTNLLILQDKFTKNIQIDTDNFQLFLENKDELKGIHISDIERFEHNAKANNKEGYLITLQYPDYLAVMKYADSESLRKTLFEAYFSIATKGKNNNTPVIEKILKLRSKKAGLLGYNSYADYSISNKMAKNTSNVLNLLMELKDNTIAFFKKDEDKILQFASSLGIKEIKHWDYMYVSSKLYEKEYSLDINEIKSYFSLNKCIDVLFHILKDNLNIDTKFIEPPFSYDPCLKLLKLYNSEKTLGYIYLDLHARKGKRSGAWMSNIVDKTKNQLPSSVIVCNFPDNKESNCLLSLSNFETLFHEFGHALHHVLSDINEPWASGVNNVPWDAIEVPSTLMEYLCYTDEVIDKASCHHKTGEQLPRKMKEKIIKGKNFLFSRNLMRQLELSYNDIMLHSDLNFLSNPYESVKSSRRSFGFKPFPEGLSELNTFRHIFSGSYASGYYSYKWSEIISAELFMSFFDKDKNSINKKAFLEYYEKYLTKGGSEEPLKLFKNLIGRKPNSKSFMYVNGLN